MDVAHPYRAVVASLDGDVLVLLAGVTRPLTGRQIAARLGSSFEGVRKSLERLVIQGIVLRDRAGGAHLHRLNREHLAASAVIALADMRTQLWARLRDAVRAWEPSPTHASVFGSAARGDGDAESDIDMFLVRPSDVAEDDRRWRGQVDRLAVDVKAWTGNDVSVIEQSEHDIRRLIAHAPPVLDDVARDGIHVTGEPIDKLLSAGRGTA